MNIINVGLIMLVSFMICTCRCPQKATSTVDFRFGFNFDTVWLSQFSYDDLKAGIEINNIELIGKTSRKLKGKINARVEFTLASKPVNKATRNIHCWVRNIPKFGNSDSFDIRKAIFTWPKGRKDTLLFNYVINGKKCPTSEILIGNTYLNSKYANVVMHLYGYEVYFFNP